MKTTTNSNQTNSLLEGCLVVIAAAGLLGIVLYAAFLIYMFMGWLVVIAVAGMFHYNLAYWPTVLGCFLVTWLFGGKQSTVYIKQQVKGKVRSK